MIYIWPQLSCMFPEQGGRVRVAPIRCFKGLDLVTKKSNVYINWSPSSEYLVNYNETTVSISKFWTELERGETLAPGWGQTSGSGRGLPQVLPEDRYRIEIDR